MISQPPEYTSYFLGRRIREEISEGKEKEEKGWEREERVREKEKEVSEKILQLLPGKRRNGNITE